MTIPRFLLLLVAIAAGTSTFSTAAEKESAFEFREVKYFHRWSKNEQHEFTPAKQEDLEHWSDMITINGYPSVDDGDKLAETANAVLGNYEKAGAKVLRTNSVPRTAEGPAEHFISALFTRPDFAEAAFARFKIVDGKGHSFVYSHRFYGDKAGDEMKTWLSANGAEVEKSLMDWNLSLEQFKTATNRRGEDRAVLAIAKAHRETKLFRCRSLRSWTTYPCKSRRFSAGSRI